MIKTEVREIPANELTVDPELQRDPASERRIARLAADWDDLLVGTLTVSAEPDGRLIVLDGQTRLAAFRRVCNEATVQPLKCETYTGLDKQQKARMLLGQNDRRAITPLTNFRLSLVAREEWALDIRDVAEMTNWFAQGSPRPTVSAHSFNCIGAVERVYRYDEGSTLRMMFALIDASWGHDRGAVSSPTVSGLGKMLSEYGEQVDRHSLAQQLSRIGVNRFISAVGDRRRTTPGMGIPGASFAYAVDLYNKGRRTRRLAV